MTLNQLGVLAWGTVTALLAASALLVVVIAGLHIDPEGKVGLDTPWKFRGLFLALKESGSLVAGILGFSGLAWSLFYKASNGDKN